MLRARKAGILTPVVYNVQHEAATIFMERVDGVTVKEALLSGVLSEEGDSELLCCLHILLPAPRPSENMLQKPMTC